jgi:ATP-dependent Clp protease protease subunit
VPPPWTPERPPPAPPPPIPIVYEDAPTPADVLAERLLERRIVLVSGHLGAQAATDATARLMLLDATGDDPIELVLGCPDGDLIAASALADTVELAGVEVRALATGALGGPALLPFAVAPRRLAQPHATFRMCEPRLDVQGRASDLAAETARHADLVATFRQRLSAATHQPVDVIATDLAAGKALDAEAAVAYGLVDEIARRHLRAV